MTLPTASTTVAGEAPRGQVQALLAALTTILSGQDERAQAQRNAAVAFLVRVASAGIAYLSQVILARWMGSHEYGIYVFVWTWVLVIGGLSTLGLPVLTMRLLPQYLERRQIAYVRGFLLGSQRAVAVSGTVFAGLGMLVVWLLGHHADNHFVLPALLAFVCIPMWTLSDLHDGIGRSRGWMTLALAPPYVMRPVLLLACMTIAHATGCTMDARSAAASAIIATWATAILQTVLVNRRFGREFGCGAATADHGLWIGMATPLYIVTLSDMALQNADVLVISAFLDPAQVGMYFAAAKTMSLMMFVNYAVGSAVANQLSALQARGDRAGLERMATDAVAWTFWPSLAGALAILALGKPLLWLFSPQFTDAYPVMFVLAIGFLARASVGPAEFVLNMLGEQTWSAAILVSSAVLSVVLSLVLVPRHGMLGAAAATATAMSTTAVLNYLAARIRLGLKISIWHSLRPH